MCPYKEQEQICVCDTNMPWIFLTNMFVLKYGNSVYFFVVVAENIDDISKIWHFRIWNIKDLSNNFNEM